MVTRDPIAILGATSQIALDFVATVAGDPSFPLRLYARRPDAARAELHRRHIQFSGTIAPIESFGQRPYDAIINFVGIGDPARAAALGAGIFAATSTWDERALAVVDRRPETPYVFLSSGAVYGDAFAAPVTAASHATIPVNALGPRNWYMLAKLQAEARHRAHGGTIVDLRVFNYISRALDPTARFMIADMIRAIETDTIFETTDRPMTRDYLHPVDFVGLVTAALRVPAGTNTAFDAYSRAPITKHDLIDVLGADFGLRHRIVDDPDVVDAFGAKPHYYSLDRRAAAFGYGPTRSSAEAIVEEVAAILGARRTTRKSA